MTRITGLTAVSLSLLLLSSCGAGDSGTGSTVEVPDTLSENYRQVTVSPEGRVEILAGRVETYGESDRSVFEEAGFREFGPDGELRLEGTADRIELLGSQDGSARGNIRINDLEADSRLSAESLDWDDGDRRLTGNGPVSINSGDGLTLTGEGFVADMAREIYRYTSGVEGTLESDDEN